MVKSIGGLHRLPHSPRSGKGDCEDYAIAGYNTLTEAGFPHDDLQLVLVRDRAIQQDHAVLAAHLDGQWLIS